MVRPDHKGCSYFEGVVDAGNPDCFNGLDGTLAVKGPWGCSSVGRAPALQAGGQGFESPQLHHHHPFTYCKHGPYAL